MNEFNIALIMLQKIRPKMFDEDWMKATKLAKELSKSSTTDKERKRKHFCYLVDEIYKKEEQDNQVS